MNRLYITLQASCGLQGVKIKPTTLYNGLGIEIAITYNQYSKFSYAARRARDCTFYSEVFGMQLKVIWAKSRNGYPAWICRYGNVVTQSTVSAMRCFKTQLKKLKSLGIDTSRFDPIPKIVEKEGIKND